MAEVIMDWKPCSLPLQRGCFSLRLVGRFDASWGPNKLETSSLTQARCGPESQFSFRVVKGFRERLGPVGSCSLVGLAKCSQSRLATG